MTLDLRSGQLEQLAQRATEDDASGVEGVEERGDRAPQRFDRTTDGAQRGGITGPGGGEERVHRLLGRGARKTGGAQQRGIPDVGLDAPSLPAVALGALRVEHVV